MSRLRKPRESKKTHEKDDLCEESPPRNTQKSPLSTESVEEISIKLIRYILQHLNNKHAIKRADIINSLKPICPYLSRSFEVVLKKANESLKSVYGLELVSVPGTSSSNKKYMVINLMQVELSLSGQEKAEYSLLLIVLAHIFMSGGTSSEEVIYQLLKKLDIIRGEDFVHDRFGDVKVLITTSFVKQLYLSKGDKHALTQPATQRMNQSQAGTQGSGGISVEYSWGPRAEKEISKANVLGFVSKIYNRSMRTWPEHYKIVQNEAQNGDVVELGLL